MLILASASPRRQELLRLITDDFAVMPADVDEHDTGDTAPEEIPELLAVRKAQALAKQHPDDVVIGCDTGVFIGGVMLGKPKDKADALRMLKMLSGKTHKVITGCAVIKGKHTERFSQTTEVTFYPMSDRELRDYIDTGEPMDKAGAYGIQEKGALLVKEIHGDYFNVVGLPVAALSRVLSAINNI